MLCAQEEIATIYLIEHLTFVFGQQPRLSTGLHGSDHDSSAMLADPEARGRGIGHLTIDLREANATTPGKYAPKDTHYVSISLASEFNCGTEVFHIKGRERRVKSGEKTYAKIMKTICNS